MSEIKHSFIHSFKVWNNVVRHTETFCITVLISWHYIFVLFCFPGRLSNSLYCCFESSEVWEAEHFFLLLLFYRKYSLPSTLLSLSCTHERPALIDNWSFLPTGGTQRRQEQRLKPIFHWLTCRVLVSSWGMQSVSRGRPWGRAPQVLLYRICNKPPSGRRGGRRLEKEGHWGADGLSGESEFPGQTVPLEVPLKVLGQFFSLKLPLWLFFMQRIKTFL